MDLNRGRRPRTETVHRAHRRRPPRRDAERSKLTYLGFLAELLEAEVDARIERRRQRRIHDARFPRINRLADFDLDVAPTIEPALIATLAASGYIAAGVPVVLLGDSGTGNFHLLSGLGYVACEQGLRVHYITAAQLVNELAKAADERGLSASSPATADSTCSTSTNSDTSERHPL